VGARRRDPRRQPPMQLWPWRGHGRVRDQLVYRGETFQRCPTCGASGDVFRYRLCRSRLQRVMIVRLEQRPESGAPAHLPHLVSFGPVAPIPVHNNSQ
jgi:hypothetical protein